jgi:hypothetical protein
MTTNFSMENVDAYFAFKKILNNIWHDQTDSACFTNISSFISEIFIATRTIFFL